jgi:hypothetical protein
MFRSLDAEVQILTIRPVCLIRVDARGPSVGLGDITDLLWRQLFRGGFAVGKCIAVDIGYRVINAQHGHAACRWINRLKDLSP